MKARHLIAAATTLLASSGAWANEYTIVDLGPHRFPYAINASGDATGTLGRYKAGIWRGGHWHHIKGNAETNAINDNGDVVGEIDIQAEIWPRNKHRRAIAMPDGTDQSIANGIAADGTIIGEYFGTAENWHCFMIDPEGSFLDPGLMDGLDSCNAYAVNGQQQMVGLIYTVGYSDMRAFLWQAGDFVDLAARGAGVPSLATALNNAGDVVGQGTLDGQPDRAFLWRGGTMTDLGNDPQYQSTIARAINDDGTIVGEAIGTGVTIAARFDSGQIIDLSTEVDNLDDWMLIDATAINADGAIVGYGTRYQRHGSHRTRAFHGFMLVPVRGK